MILRPREVVSVNKTAYDLTRRIEGRWMRVVGAPGMYVYHRRNPSTRTLEQIVVSGNPAIDGVYVIKEFHLEECRRGQRRVLRMRVGDCDQTVGPCTVHQLRAILLACGIREQEIHAVLSGQLHEAEEMEIDLI